MAESSKKKNSDDAQDLDEVREQMRQKMGFNDEATNITLMAVDELAEQAAEMEKVQTELEAARRELQRTQLDLEGMREALATHQAEVELAEAEAQERTARANKQAEAAAKQAAEAKAKADANAKAEADANAKANDAAAATNGTTDATAEALHAELKETKNLLLRKAADFENYRRRSQRDLAESRSRARADAAQPFLDVLDDLGRTLDAARESQQKGEGGAAFTSLLEGLEMVQAKFLGEFAKLGVLPIDAVGQPFNEQYHEALMQQPAPDGTTPGTVLHEIKKGYQLGDRVIRHAQVIVAQ